MQIAKNFTTLEPLSASSGVGLIEKNVIIFSHYVKQHFLRRGSCTRRIYTWVSSDTVDEHGWLFHFSLLIVKLYSFRNFHTQQPSSSYEKFHLGRLICARDVAFDLLCCEHAMQRKLVGKRKGCQWWNPHSICRDESWRGKEIKEGMKNGKNVEETCSCSINCLSWKVKTLTPTCSAAENDAKIGPREEKLKFPFHIVEKT